MAMLCLKCFLALLVCGIGSRISGFLDDLTFGTGVERQAEVRSDDLDIDVRLPAQTVAPIHQAVALRIDGSLPDGTRPLLAQGPAESATATARSTLNRNLRTGAPEPAGQSGCEWQ